jgi:hypothetical protein
MNTRKIMLVVAAIVGGGAALAQSPIASTRAEIEVGESAGLHRLVAAPSQRSRAEVHAEALAATRARAINSRFEDGALLDRQLSMPSTLSRAQVRAEAIEARRLALYGHGEGDQRLPTASELESIRQAGLRAVGAESLARRR